jgi:hypothetical protein
MQRILAQTAQLGIEPRSLVGWLRYGGTANRRLAIPSTWAGTAWLHAEWVSQVAGKAGKTASGDFHLEWSASGVQESASICDGSGKVVWE